MVLSQVGAHCVHELVYGQVLPYHMGGQVGLDAITCPREEPLGVCGKGDGGGGEDKDRDAVSFEQVL